MHRSVPAFAAALAMGSVLAAAGPAAADDGPLAPGDTRSIQLPVPEKWTAALQVDVTVGASTQLENDCLDPERKAGDDCLPDGGDLAGQLTGIVALGVSDGPGCVRGESAILDLSGTRTARLTAKSPGVACLFVELTFRDDASNNLAQSDSLTFDLDLVARDYLASEPDGSSADGDEQVDERAPLDIPARDTGATDGGDAATDVRASDQDDDGVTTSSGDGADQVPDADSGTLVGAPADRVRTVVDEASNGPVLDRLNARVSVGDDGVVVQTEAAESSMGGEVLAWASLLLGAVALGWSAFVLVLRRRRKKVAA